VSPPWAPWVSPSTRCCLSLCRATSPPRSPPSGSGQPSSIVLLRLRILSATRKALVAYHVWSTVSGIIPEVLCSNIWVSYEAVPRLVEHRCFVHFPAVRGLFSFSFALRARSMGDGPPHRVTCVAGVTLKRSPRDTVDEELGERWPSLAPPMQQPCGPCRLRVLPSWR